VRSRLLFALLVGAGLSGSPFPGRAAVRQVTLEAPTAQVAIRAYGLGLLPLDGTFLRFHGVLTYDPNDHAACQVQLVVEVASLSMSDSSTRDTIVGPDFMDASRFPSLAFSGTCQADTIGGNLTLHGISGPFQLHLAWDGDHIVAEGSLLRAKWGMTAMPLMGGRTVRIRVSAPLS
jgi:polyisoprenoid-binding protein YceI